MAHRPPKLALRQPRRFWLGPPSRSPLFSALLLTIIIDPPRSTFPPPAVPPVIPAQGDLCVTAVIPAKAGIQGLTTNRSPLPCPTSHPVTPMETGISQPHAGLEAGITPMQSPTLGCPFVLREIEWRTASRPQPPPPFQPSTQLSFRSAARNLKSPAPYPRRSPPSTLTPNSVKTKFSTRPHPITNQPACHSNENRCPSKA